MKILILGGGVGGQVASNLLGKRLDKKHDVVVVDKRAQFEFEASFPWVMMGRRKPHQITRNLSLLEKRGVKFVNGEVLKIDLAERIVKTSVGDLPYDYLIVALGAELVPEAIPGFSESAHHIYTLVAAMKLQEKLRNFSGGTVAVGVSSLPFKCPAAPYEAALLMDYYFKKKGIRQKVDLQFFTAEGRPMGVAPPEIGNMVKRMVENRNISYQPNLKLTSVDSEKREITFNGGKSMNFDLLFAVPPHRASSVVKESRLTDESGWVSVDRKTLKTKYDNVYAIGDVTKIMLKMGKPLPKAGVFAHGQAKVVAHNIVADIQGNREREFDGWGECFLEVGYGKAGMVRGNFYAEPVADAKMRWPKLSRMWHWSKVLFEKYWLWRYF